jgi:hypothetical protein
MVELNSDWREWLRLLTACRVRFVIVGGHAVAANGRPRLTADLDVFIEPTRANARRVLQALHAFGFGDLGITEDRFSQPDKVTMLGRVPHRIDLITGIDGVSFREAWRGRMLGDLGGMRVAFLGRAELLRNKLASGRPKDLADLALLTELEEPKTPAATRPARATPKRRPRKKARRS